MSEKLESFCPSNAANCSRSLRARLRDVIQKFRDEEGYLLLDKSSRALGGAIAYGDMATALSKLIEKPDKVEDMMTMLCRIGYPRRGTTDERATIESFAAEIQQRWTLQELIPGPTDAEWASFSSENVKQSCGEAVSK